MTSEACREMRASLATSAMGHLEPAEEVALRAHLDGCAECRAELRELESVARALPLADPDRIAEARVEPPLELGERVSDRVARERDQRKSRRRTRALAGAGAALLAVAAALVLVFALSSSSSPGGREKVVFTASHGVAATANLDSRPGGTEVAFRVTGLRDGDEYWLWLTGDDGQRISAGTFRGAQSPLKVTMTAAIRLHDARRVWVTDSNKAVVLDAHLSS